MITQNIRALVTYRLEQADESLDSARVLLEKRLDRPAVNRAYYAIFHAANAMLATRGLARSKHSGVISAFRQHFVKPGLIETDYSEVYGRLMDHRNVSDYEVELLIENQQAYADLHDARRFIQRAEQWLKQEGWL